MPRIGIATASMSGGRPRPSVRPSASAPRTMRDRPAQVGVGVASLGIDAGGDEPQARRSRPGEDLGGRRRRQRHAGRSSRRSPGSRSG